MFFDGHILCLLMLIVMLIGVGVVIDEMMKAMGNVVIVCISARHSPLQEVVHNSISVLSAPAIF